MNLQAKEPATLYLVGTPIGNLEDLTFRALRTLRQVRWVAAEDTRETRKLLESQGIQNQLFSLHEHSADAKVASLVERLSQGDSGAYVSDAGTPGICDPGAALVRAAAAAGIRIVPIPGASAPVTLLSVAGSDYSAFSFSGFFAREKSDRKIWGEKALLTGGLHVFFESPHRIQGTLEFLSEAFPLGRLVVGRELTKKFETITRGTCQEVHLQIGEEEPRGEYVLSLELPLAEEARPEGLSGPKLEAHLADLVELGANQKILLRVAMAHGQSKNTAYAMALKALGKSF
jgi:16S rRNA (cytidine1402-2'-O)-methyltransferase